MENKILYLVHCVDTEGPLYESTEVTFRLLKQTVRLDIFPSVNNLCKLQSSKDVPQKIRSLEEHFVSVDSSLNYNTNWHMIHTMLRDILYA